jgi:hypothetical protein
MRFRAPRSGAALPSPPRSANQLEHAPERFDAARLGRQRQMIHVFVAFLAHLVEVYFPTLAQASVGPFGWIVRLDSLPVDLDAEAIQDGSGGYARSFVTCETFDYEKPHFVR